MNIDIDRLHMVDKGRRDGRSVEILIKALQNSEFYPNEVAIIAHTAHWAKGLLRMAYDLAESMDYPVEQIHDYKLKINGVIYSFLTESRLERFREGRNLVIFHDNYVGSDVEPLRRARDSIKKFADGLKDLDVSVKSTDKAIRRYGIVRRPDAKARKD